MPILSKYVPVITSFHTTNYIRLYKEERYAQFRIDEHRYVSSLPAGHERMV